MTISRPSIYWPFFLLLTGFFILTTSLVRAQGPGGIQGRVVLASGQPAIGASVVVSGTGAGASTDVNGHFEIGDVAPGNHTLTVRLVGHATQERRLMVPSGVPITQNFMLSESTEELSEVTVQGDRANKFVRRSSDYVAKMPLKNLENPQVYATVGKELLAEQLVFTADDATRNVPGLQKMWDATGRAGDGGGFYSSRGFIVSSQLRNGVAGNVTSDIDAINLEKLEVIKGPSGTLFGGALSSYGGLVNRVTKKPLDAFGGELTVAGGSYAFHRVSADVNLVDANAPADQPKNLAFRLNTAYTYEDSYQTRGYTGFSKNLAVAPSLQWRPSDRLTVNLDAEIYKGTGTSKPIFFFYNTSAALGFDRADKAPLDYRQSYTGAGLVQDSRSTNLFGQVQYRISPAFTSTTFLTSSHSFSNGSAPYFYLLPARNGGIADRMVRADQSTGNSERALFEVQQLFNGDFQVGRMRNRVVLGLDYLRIDPKINFLGGNFDTISLSANSATLRAFNGPALAARYAAQAPGSYIVNVKSNTYSAFASDVLNLTEQLSVLAAVRLDHIDSKGGLYYSPVEAYTQTLLSPKFGVVFQPVKDRVALFANYQNSFTNLGVYLTPDGKFPLARPERANQWEAGVKLDAGGGRFSATVSYYDIYVKDRLRNLGYDATRAFRSIDVQDANQRSKGVDVSIIANPVRGFNVVAGFGYNDSKFETPDETVNGRRPNNASSPIVANAWLSYRQPAGALQGLGLGFGGNYASENRVQNTTTNIFTLPSYTVLNASVFYDQPRYRLSAKVDNLTDKQYWTGYTTMNPQKLRSIVGSVAYKF